MNRRVNRAELIGAILGSMMFYIIATGCILYTTYNAFAPGSWPAMSIWEAWGFTVLVNIFTSKEKS